MATPSTRLFLWKILIFLESLKWK